jgi:hypothetical protein
LALLTATRQTRPSRSFNILAVIQSAIANQIDSCGYRSMSEGEVEVAGCLIRKS